LIDLLFFIFSFQRNKIVRLELGKLKRQANKKSVSTQKKSTKDSKPAAKPAPAKEVKAAAPKEAKPAKAPKK
jgi:hypothetical protein